MLYLSFVYQMYLRTYQINKMQCKIECLQRNKLRITKKNKYNENMGITRNGRRFVLQQGDCDPLIT